MSSLMPPWNRCMFYSRTSLYCLASSFAQTMRLEKGFSIFNLYCIDSICSRHCEIDVVCFPTHTTNACVITEIPMPPYSLYSISPLILLGVLLPKDLHEPQFCWRLRIGILTPQCLFLLSHLCKRHYRPSLALLKFVQLSSTCYHYRGHIPEEIWFHLSSLINEHIYCRVELLA